MVVNCFGAIIEYFATFAFLWIFFDQHPDRTVWRKIGHVAGPLLFLIFASCISSAYIRPLLFVIYSWVIAYGFEGDLWQRVFSVSLFQISLILLEFLIVGFSSTCCRFNTTRSLFSKQFFSQNYNISNYFYFISAQ